MPTEITHELDEATIASFAEIDLQEKLWAASLNGARSAILGHFCRQNQLEGAWRVAPNGKELVKVEVQNGGIIQQAAQAVAGE